MAELYKCEFCGDTNEYNNGHFIQVSIESDESNINEFDVGVICPNCKTFNLLALNIYIATFCGCTCDEDEKIQKEFDDTRN